MPTMTIPRLPTVTRRRVLRGSLALPALLAGRPARAAGIVDVLAYDGMVPKDLQRQFEAESGLRLRIRSIASQAPELNLLIAERGRPTADVCVAVGHRLAQFDTAGVIAPVDVRRLRHWDRIDPHFTAADWLRVGGQTMGVPTMLSAERLVYNTAAMPAPDSWGAMFDRGLKRRTAYVVEDFLQCAMLLQGNDGGFGSYVGRPAAAQAAVDAARDLLIRHKANVLKFYEDGAELVQLLAGEDVVLAQTYSGLPTKLVLDGRPFGFVVPREGSLGSVYSFSLVRNGPNPDGAYRFLDALLAHPGIGAAVTRASGNPSTFLGAEAELSDLEKRAFLVPPADLENIRIRSSAAQALNSALIDRAVEEVKAG